MATSGQGSHNSSVKQSGNNRRRFLEVMSAGAGATLVMGAATSLLGQTKPRSESKPRAATNPSYSSFRDEIFSLPVWDTHNHLATSEYLCARSFWDMGHYFWFAGELHAAGYPPLKDVMAMDEPRRADAFVRAYHLTRNTMWHRSFAQTLKDLWNIEIADARSVLDANARIAETGKATGWARKVCQKAGLAKLTLQDMSRNGLQEISDLTYTMAGGFNFFGQLREFRQEKDQRAALERVAKLIEPEVRSQAEKNMHVYRIVLPESTEVPELKATDNSREVLVNYIGNAVLDALNKYRAHIQVFVGVERDPMSSSDAPPRRTEGRSSDSSRSAEALAEMQNRSYALNDPARIAKMHSLFDKYPDCTFEIINAAQLSNLDIVQTANIYRNVIPGGMWWFNFRTSIYNEMMQYRLEALPATRCTLVATDARSIEWAYCKTITTKDLLARFLWKQMQEGYIDRELALFVAKEWLYGTASRLYR